MTSYLALLGAIARLTYSAEETFALMIGTYAAPVGYTHDARTSVLAHFRYLGLDVYMDQFFAELQERAKENGFPVSQFRVTADGRTV